MQIKIKQLKDLFIIKKLLGQGTFSLVYQVLNIKTNQISALKIFKQNKKNSRSFFKQVQILKILKNVKQTSKIISYGTFQNNFFIQLQKYQHNLYHFSNERKIQIEQVNNIAYQLIIILKQIHQNKILHRDIKPQNIVFNQDYSKIFIIDFGTSIFFIDEQNKHYQMRKNRGFIGTLRYASKAAHLGYQLGRKDELQSLGYLLIFLQNKKLPWSSLSYKNEQQMKQKLMKKKLNITIKQLCLNMPQQYELYFSYVNQLQFNQKPNYNYLANLFNPNGQIGHLTQFSNRLYFLEFNQSINIHKNLKESLKPKFIKELQKIQNSQINMSLKLYTQINKQQNVPIQYSQNLFHPKLFSKSFQTKFKYVLKQ